MSGAAITALGIGQLVNWGVLYYAFAVLLLPVQRDLGVPSWVVTGAFSLALLVSAVLAPLVGRWSDRGHAPRAIVLGGIGAAALLALWAAVPSVLTLYVAWAGLGVCMATALYEPAFAIVTRAHGSADARLRALAIITVYGGLASTVFLPVTDGLVTWVGWRVAVLILAGLLVASTAVAAMGVRDAPQDVIPTPIVRSAVGRVSTAGDVGSLAVVFGLSSLASASLIANLVPALGERGLQPTTAALLGGLFGVMQLPGRALMVQRRVKASGESLVAISLGLQAAGLIAVATLPTVAVAAGVMIFAAGSGLTALARPYLVQGRFGPDQTGVVNGQLARVQQLTRAAGPIAASSAATLTSHVAVLACLGVALGLLAWRVTNNQAGSS